MMEEQTLSLSDYLAILNRRKWQLIAPAILIFIIALGVAVALPTLYRSSATILIEQQEIPMDLVRSTITTYADRRIQVIKQRVMTTENLAPIIDRYNLYPDLVLARGTGSAVDRMRKDIEVAMIDAGPGTAAIAFSVSYEAGSPTLAQQVTEDLASLFLNENVRERKHATREISRFLDQESNRLAEQVSVLEAKLARFKEQHGDAIPEMTQVNVQLLHRTEDSLKQTEQEIQSLEVNQIYLQSELAKLNPYAMTTSSGSGERAVTPAERLKTLETELLRLTSRYSDAHPDRMAAEREIAALRGQVGGNATADLRRQLTDQRRQLTDLRSRRSSEHPDVKAMERQIALTEQRLLSESRTGAGGSATVADATNPVYIQMETQLSINQSKLDALREMRGALKARLAGIEARVAEGPKIEREYRLITRDYDGAVDKYKQVRSKHMEAVLAESLEQESKGERFALIEPPLLPDRPSSPNLPKIILLGLVMAVGGGAASVAGLEAIDGRIYSLRAIQNISGSLPLAVIPLIETPADQRRRRLKLLAFVLGSIAVVTLLFAAIHVFMMPLDVLWIAVSEKVGSIVVGLLP
jgi:polysaccharide biosynthesis transport protein